MANMATMNEKILAMLANIKELRKTIKKEPLATPPGLISQKDFILELGLSDRTARRRISELLANNQISKEKRGKAVFYRKNANYPH